MTWATSSPISLAPVAAAAAARAARTRQARRRSRQRRRARCPARAATPGAVASRRSRPRFLVAPRPATAARACRCPRARGARTGAARPQGRSGSGARPGGSDEGAHERDEPLRGLGSIHEGHAGGEQRAGRGRPGARRGRRRGQASQPQHVSASAREPTPSTRPGSPSRRRAARPQVPRARCRPELGPRRRERAEVEHGGLGLTAAELFGVCHDVLPFEARGHRAGQRPARGGHPPREHSEPPEHGRADRRLSRRERGDPAKSVAVHRVGERRERVLDRAGVREALAPARTDRCWAIARARTDAATQSGPIVTILPTRSRAPR